LSGIRDGDLKAMFQKTHKRFWRTVACVTALTTAWLAVPHQAFAKPPAKPKPYSRLTEKGMTQTPSAAQRKKIAAREATAQAGKQQPDARALSAAEMQAVRGRGPYRNAYFSGAPMPWHRSFRDVNLVTGNLMKSVTDIQVAPARGAGLVLQRTYNSNDERVGPFGVGWTHAYDIRMDEAGVNPQGDEVVPRTDFFGGKHKYKRDADGLYSPPAYLFDELDSKYAEFLVNGPTEVLEDKQVGMDGTVKYFVRGGTDPDGSPSSTRVCDYMEDRHGNRTTFTYQTVSLPGGGSKKLLTQVTDPSNRSLVFTWQNRGTAQAPAYRIVEAAGPMYRVTYDYNAELNLWKVHLDPDGLNRTTTYGYTQYEVNNVVQETGLLSSISDPLGHAVTFHYAPGYLTGTLWVDQVTEPGSGGVSGVWNISPWSSSTPTSVFSGNGTGVGVLLFVNSAFQAQALRLTAGVSSFGEAAFSYEYDTFGNQLMSNRTAFNEDPNTGNPSRIEGRDNIKQYFTYGPHGNVLTSYFHGFANKVTTYSYFNASKYFQKESVTDPTGRVTRFDYFDKFDANVGNRGNVKWVRDAGYDNPQSPSYQKQFAYTYNQHGQKASETNLNGSVTQFTYGDTWGNLTQVVQDYGTGKLNRTTQMVHDMAGRVQQSTDPMGRTSTFGYNTLGQPTSASFPATANTPATPAENITYNYGLNGRTDSVTDNRGTTTIAYESGNDRVSSVTDPVTGTIGYTYGVHGERLSVALPGGGSWTYNYLNWTMLSGDNPDSAMRTLTTITDDAGRTVRMYVDGTTGAPREIHSNRNYPSGGTELAAYMRTRYERDQTAPDAQGVRWSHGWTRQVSNTWRWKDTNGVWQERLLSQNDYTYDNGTGQRATNQITDSFNNARTETYGYDDLSRLTSVNYGDGQSQGYAFDAMGNRLSKTDNWAGSENYTYNAANMLLSRGGQAYTNDANGNTLTGGGRTNTWDSQNRLVNCVYNNGSTTSTSSFTYGADGLRREATFNGNSTHYALDGPSVVREFAQDSQNPNLLTVAATYLIGPQGPMYRSTPTVADVKWYLYDGLGSVLGEVDVNGNVSATKKHDVYGLPRQVTGTPTAKHGFVGSLGHTSEDETGMVYMRARYYDPSIGRFASEDAAHDGVNWFIYCNNDPVNQVDASGKASDAAYKAFGYLLALLSAVHMGLAFYGVITNAIALWEDFKKAMIMGSATSTAPLGDIGLKMSVMTYFYSDMVKHGKGVRDGVAGVIRGAIGIRYGTLFASLGEDALEYLEPAVKLFKELTGFKEIESATQ
jgi:RHS repeat-associated protein